MRYQHLTATLCCTLVLLCAVTASAQSGRRKTTPPPSAPVPTPTPEPTPVPKKENKEPELLFLVGADRQGSFSIPFTYFDAVVRGCADRLRARSPADVDIAQQELRRGDAIKKAKSETNTYVVVIGLTYDSMARSPDDLVVDFVVLIPGTAKVLTTGRSYLSSNRVGPLVVGRPSPIPGGLYREEMFRIAGEEAADRILKKMNLGGVVPK